MVHQTVNTNSRMRFYKGKRYLTQQEQMEKMVRPHGEAKVINYRLIEEHPQTFNEGLFLPYCKLIINVFEKQCECSFTKHVHLL